MICQFISLYYIANRPIKFKLIQIVFNHFCNDGVLLIIAIQKADIFFLFLWHQFVTYLWKIARNLSSISWNACISLLFFWWRILIVISILRFNIRSVNFCVFRILNWLSCDWKINLWHRMYLVCYWLSFYLLFIFV